MAKDSTIEHRLLRPMAGIGGDPPRLIPNPFDEPDEAGSPHPWARVASLDWMAELANGSTILAATSSARSSNISDRDEQVGTTDPYGFFGVLVVRAPSGDIGVLRSAPGRENRSVDLVPALDWASELRNVSGATRTLAALTADVEGRPAIPCVTITLLAHALRAGLTPIAGAQFWWGPPPPGGARLHGTFYPACRDVCGAVLPFLLEGLPIGPHHRHVRVPPREPTTLVFEDHHVLVVAKPAGLLSVPGTDPNQRDTLLARLHDLCPPPHHLVHRLDQETSGLLVVAKSLDAYRNLQRQFTARTVHKTYRAILEGSVERNEGIIELPLRLDVAFRPRQVVDFVHGKPARTRFTVEIRSASRCQVSFVPETGRTHQLRVHAAHPAGLDAAIVGDGLYGCPGPRLLLHAESLSFDHPITGARISVRSPAPFGL